MAQRRAKCPKCGRVFDRDPAAEEQVVCPCCGATLRSRTAPKASSADPLIGQTLGTYEILELLGKGGTGTVYKAKQPGVRVFYALKVLSPELARFPDVVERFQREGRGARAISHRNAIRVIEVGNDKGRDFIAMEYVEGETLNARLKRAGPLPPPLLLDVLKQTLSALAAAHGQGIAHRDIKPSNILFTAAGCVKIADFGLAKRLGVDASVTVTGMLLGTPEYMSPEVAMGEQADGRSDIYSLGVTLYHLATGRCPFDAPNAARVLLKHIEQEPAPLALVAPHVPQVLRDVIHRMMAKDPADRYQCAREVAEALAGNPPNGPAQRRPKKAEQRRWKWVVIVALGVGVLVLAAVLALLFLRP